ncbi:MULTISPECIES: hypothetical protein [unclassified Streptomyces]|uniref:hypothetical protein n=1 Tax=unclassified Streptomyces TaxID=2593676 RepID=UPI00278BF950|nr:MULTISPECIES: hypothetical protein [unclassified Streptomyces]
MANNPQGPGPQGNPDPAGNTQMFRAFVDEQPQGRRQAAAAPAKSGPGAGLIIGIVLAVIVVAAVAWLAFK